MLGRKTRTKALAAGALAFIAAMGLLWGTGFAAGVNVPGIPALPSYTLAFYNIHTRENLAVTYRIGNFYRDAAMDKVDRFFRDHRNGHTHEIDGRLMDLLHDMQVILQKRYPDVDIVYHVISGYRSKETNDRLRAAGGGQGKKSQHIEGKAVDIKIPGIPIEVIRDTAWCLQRGGVGFYRGSGFVHVDTGKVRHWNWAPTAKTCARKTS